MSNLTAAELMYLISARVGAPRTDEPYGVCFWHVRV